MAVKVAIQCLTDEARVPKKDALRTWVESALSGHRNDAELSIRIVDENESKALNARWRRVAKATNVLSFPAGEINQYCTAMLGDLAICAPVVEREAQRQGKSSEAHWAHMVVHGTLHLLGYDHVKARDAEQMESLESAILTKLSYPDPYISDHH